MNDGLASEAAGRMTLQLALSLYRQASTWLRDALERNTACSCGSCHLCAYRYLEQNTRQQPAPPYEPDGSDAPIRDAAPPAGELDFERLAEEIEDWMPDESPGEMSHKEYIRQFAAFLKNRIDFGINPCPLSADQIRYMVDRFLGWRLPKPWNPDNGISYVRPNYMHPPADHDWPTGTNLFDWSQAEAMVRYMVEGMPGLAARPKVEDAREDAIDRELAPVRQRALSEAVHRYEAAEAELAKARKVIELCRQPLDGAPSLIAREAIAAWDTRCHAARQQQKDGAR